MANAALSATARSGVGTGDARKLRRTGFVPGVVYGHGRAPQSLSVDVRDLDRLLSTVAVSTTVVELNLDGVATRTLVREIQRHPFKRHILHVDFQELVAGEKVTVRVPLRFVGASEGVKNGGVLEEVMHDLEIRMDPTNIPNHIDIDVTSLTIGHGIHVSAIPLPAGAEALADPDATVCTVTVPRAAVEAAPAAEVVEPVAGEPELIRKTKPGETEEEG
jgi:large subunit ribosomal protein L25